MLDSQNVIDLFPDKEAMDNAVTRLTEADLDDGFAPIANAYLDMLACGRFTQRQVMVIAAVMRMTYGEKDPDATRIAKKYRSKKNDRITGDDLAEKTGLSSRKAASILSELIGMNVIKREGGARGFVGMNTKVWQWILPESKNSQKNMPPKAEENSEDKNGGFPQKMGDSSPQKMGDSGGVYKEDTKDTKNILFAETANDASDDEKIGDQKSKKVIPKKVIPAYYRDDSDIAGKTWDELTEKQRVRAIFKYYNDKLGADENRKRRAINLRTGDYTANGRQCLRWMKKGYTLKAFKILISHAVEMAQSSNKWSADLWGFKRANIKTMLRPENFEDYLDEAAARYHLDMEELQS